MAYYRDRLRAFSSMLTLRPPPPFQVPSAHASTRPAAFRHVLRFAATLTAWIVTSGGLRAAAPVASTTTAATGSGAYPASSASSGTSTSSAPAGTAVDVPDVARRLWHDLLCTCDEPDCSQQSLEGCHCPFAAKERQKILDRVRLLGFGTERQDELTYSMVFREYVAERGAKADGVQSNATGLWLAATAIFVGILAMGTVAIVRVIRRPKPSRELPVRSLHAQTRGRPKNKRDRKHRR